MPDWLVARAQTGCQNAASERVRKLGFEVFFPRYRQPLVNYRTRRKFWISRPLYGNYLFVKSPQFHFFLRDVEGIVSVVMAGLTPARSETLDQAVAIIQQNTVDGFVDMDEIAPQAKPDPAKFVCGQMVRIVGSALAGRTGLISKIEANRVQLLVKMLAREIPVWYRTQDVEGETINHTSPGSRVSER